MVVLLGTKYASAWWRHRYRLRAKQSQLLKYTLYGSDFPGGSMGAVTSAALTAKATRDVALRRADMWRLGASGGWVTRLALQ